MPHNHAYTKRGATVDGAPVAGEWHVREYHDVAAWFNVARVDRASEANRNHNERTGWSDTDNWRGGTIYDADTMQTWPDGLRLFEEAKSVELPELPAPVSRRRVRRFDVGGDEFDRDRFDAGYPEHWQRRERRNARGSAIIRLTVDIGAPCSHSADQLRWTGIATARLVDDLENAGYRVEVIAVCASRQYQVGRRPGYHCADVITVKSADDPLDIDSLLLATAHPFSYRYFACAAVHRRPAEASAGWGFPGMGIPDFLRGDIHIEKCYDREAAIRQTRAALDNYSAAALDICQA